jgi:hypothetical protein
MPITDRIKTRGREKARDLQKTEYNDATVGPDLTYKQKQEKNMREEVGRKNKEEITEDILQKTWSGGWWDPEERGESSRAPAEKDIK